ncbi:MAG: hypothetical protein LQ339_007610 [Xanthoria mediterranea]|nr:MAG: hypothetical protein LQ339_007610 [Xanthoria mediterranea]
MDKITDKIAALPNDASFFSLEFFPPKTQIGFSNLQDRLQRMSQSLRPLFVNVTWGAGGCTASRSLELAEICQRQLGLTTCLHLTCTNMKRKVVDEALREAQIIGVRNILALRGDPPRDEEYRLDTEDGEEEEEVKENNEEFIWAADLVRYIRRTCGDFFCIGVAAYPEGHSDESHPREQSYEKDLPYLIEKVQAGADFLVTQFFFDVRAYTRFETTLREHDSKAFRKIPIIPGLLPIQNYQILKRTTKLAHCRIPPGLLEALDPIKADDEEVKRKGIHAISDMIREIQAVKSDAPRGFHFYTLNLEKVVGSILENCNLVPPETLVINGEDSTTSDLPATTKEMNGITQKAVNGISQLCKPSDPPSSRRGSTTSNYLTTTNNDSASSAPNATNTAINTTSREATWDDYPNGRFGDARSPAFGTPISYSPYSLPCTPAQARSLWGEPTSLSAITNLFTSHLSGKSVPQLPWSDDSSPSLSSETALIRDHLLTLTTTRNWWTIASQPAADGVPSTDPIHGWGPAKGFVFQKPFVELFCPTNDWDDRLKPFLKSASIAPEISFYAGTSSGRFESSESSDAVHAVTWGSFLGKEIMTATMVEEVSFRQWCEEAFGRWEEWARCCRDGAARAFLRRQREGVVLVNVIGHRYRDGEGDRLWKVLREAVRR